MGLIAWSAIFIAALAVLVKSADLFISASVRAGHSLNIPPFLIGVLLVGFGTSLPELVSSVVSVPAGTSEIVVGNVLGSNITNILLVLGIAGVVGGTFHVQTDLLKFDLPVMAGGAFVLGLMISDGQFTVGEGLVCLSMFVVYIVVTIKSGDNAAREEDDERKATGSTWATLVVSPILIFLGAKFTVDAVIEVAKLVDISADTIAMSAVALGTSLPEVIVALTATRQGQPDIVVGNIIGSNIFNTFAVMGIPAMLGRLVIPENVVTYSLPVFIAVTILYVFITVDHRITRGEGAFLIMFYLFFLGRLFSWI